jgi:2-polyprenyl-3-methyl-5-hydroxy-6-metoxy-1,4-benzoquinol methylase
MSHLRETLIAQYSDHYGRRKASLEPQAIAAPLHQMLQLNYGRILSAVPPGGRILDVGCGTGYLLSWLGGQPQLRLSGIDSSVSQVRIAQAALPDLDITCGDAIPYLRARPGQFDVIFCLDVLEHVGSDDLLELTEAARAALIPGGCFICKVPNAANLAGPQLRYHDLTHERSFTESSLWQLLNAAGFENCRVIPVQVPHLTGRVRLHIERALHRVVFRICGDAGGKVFTRTLAMAADAPH